MSVAAVSSNRDADVRPRRPALDDRAAPGPRERERAPAAGAVAASEHASHAQSQGGIEHESARVRRARLCELCIRGGLLAARAILRALHPTAVTLRAHLLSPDIEKRVRRLRVRGLLSAREFNFLYYAGADPTHAFDHSRTQSSLYSFVYDDNDEPLLISDLDPDAPSFQTGLTLPDLLCVLLLVLKVACDLSPANARAPISEAADSEDEEFLEEEQLEEEEASPGLATLLVQFDRFRETLAEQVAPSAGLVVAALEGFNARAYKQCWQSLVLLFRDVVEALSPLPAATAAGDEGLAHLDVTSIVIERLKVSLNSAIKRAKHMELSERDALIDALEHTLIAWHRRELHVRVVASETAAAIDRRATELPEIQVKLSKRQVLQRALYTPKQLESLRAGDEGSSRDDNSSVMSAIAPWNDIKNGMELEKRTAIARHYEELVHAVKPDMLIDQLVKRRVLSIRESSLVFSSPFSEFQMHTLLDLLVRKETGPDAPSDGDRLPDAFEELVYAIGARYPEIAAKLHAEYEKLAAEASAVQKAMTTNAEDHLATYRQILRLYYEHEIMPKLSSQPYVGFSNPDTRLADYFINPLFTTIYGDPVSPFEMFAIPSTSVSPNGARDSSGGGGDSGAGGGGGGLIGGGVEVSGGDPMLGGKSATAITLGSGGAIDAGAEARVSATRTPRLVLVEGECGAGKTTLALHLLRRWCTNPACFLRATFDFVLHVDLRLLLLSMEACEATLKEGGERAVRGGRSKRRSRRQLEDDVQTAQARFDLKSVLADQFLLALSAAAQHSDAIAKLKLSKREAWELLDENQSRLLIVLDNFEPLLLGNGSSASNMMDTSTFAVTNLVGALESLLYGAIVPGARIVLLAAPEFSAALQEQFDAKFLLLGLPPSAQSRLAFVRNYCTITGARSDSFHVLTSIFEQSAASAAQRAEKRGLRRKPGAKPGAAFGGHARAGDSTHASLEKEASRAKHAMHAVDVREHAKGALSKALLDETKDMLESLGALKRSQRARPVWFTMQAMLQSLTRVPLHFSLLLSTIDLSQRLETMTGARMVSVPQIVGSLLTAHGTTSTPLAVSFLFDQVISILKIYMSQTTSSQNRGAINKSFLMLQERALEQLGGYNIVFGRQAAQLIAAHERELAESPEKTPSRHSRLTRAGSGLGGSDSGSGGGDGGSGGGSLERSAAGAAKQVGSTRHTVSGGTSMTLSPHAEEHEAAPDASLFAIGTTASLAVVQDILARSGLVLLAGTDLLARVHQNKWGRTKQTFFYFRNRLLQEFLASRHLDSIVSNEFASVARQANEDPKKYFVSLIQNRCLLNLNLFYATGKLMHQGALQVTAAEANSWLRCYLDSFAAYAKYLITSHTINKPATGSHHDDLIGDSQNQSSDNGPTPVRQTDSAGRTALGALAAASRSAEAWKKTPRVPPPSVAGVQLSLLLDLLNLLINPLSTSSPNAAQAVAVQAATASQPPGNYLENTCFRQCLELLPSQLVLRNGFRDGASENERLFSKLSKDPELNFWVSGTLTLHSISGACVAVESRFSHITELVIQLNGETRATSEQLFYRLAESVCSVSTAQYAVEAEVLALYNQQLSTAAVTSKKGGAKGARADVGSPLAGTPRVPVFHHLQTLKLYWNSIDFLARFLYICFPPATAEDSPAEAASAPGEGAAAAKQEGPATQQQRKGPVKTKQPVPRRSTISRLVCVYEWSPTAQLSQRARAAPSPAKAPEAGAVSGGEGEANGDEDREQEPDANMHTRVGAHGGGWQTHLKVALDHLTATKQLREFSFKRCRQLRIMALVARYLPATERLERLALTGSAIQVFQAQDLVSAIADNKSLRKLKLAHMKFDTITFNCLVELLRVNKSITEFDLSGIQHVDKQVFQLIEAMKLNTKLEFLDLQDIQFSLAGCEQLAQLLRINKSLRLLKVSNPRLDLAGLRVMQDAANVLMQAGRPLRVDGV